MATNFPASLDSLTNPSSSDSLNSPSHSAQHANSNDAIEALQAKVGADGSAVTSSHDYKIANLESRPVETKTASYTLVAADVNKRIVMNNAGATTITVNDAVFSAGDTVWLHNIGAGTTTVTAGTATVDTAGSLDVGQWEGGSLYFTSASSAIFFRGGGAVNYGAATGGTSSTITVGGESYTLLTFTSSNTLTVTKAGLFDILCVAGGATGANSSLACGGGGAGGYTEFTGVYFDANQTVTIGGAGGRTGGISACGHIATAGGGAGGSVNLRGDNGASGGGMGYTGGAGYGVGITNQGNRGGSWSGNSGGGGGGGGGAGGIGANGSGATGGNGGAGKDASAFRGETAGTTYYARGGKGASTNVTHPAGGANTGNGGGGGGNSSSSSAGGSGIVLVRFKN